MIEILFVQFLGTVVAAIAATVEIESILSSGPMLTVFSLLIAALAFRSNMPLVLYLALATPTVAVICFALIYGLHWQPNDAHLPITAIIWMYAIVQAAIWLNTGCSFGSSGPPLKTFVLRFNLRFLFAITLVVSGVLACLQSRSHACGALGILIGYSTMLVWVLWQFNRQRQIAAGHQRVEPAIDERIAG